MFGIKELQVGKEEQLSDLSTYLVHESLPCFQKIFSRHYELNEMDF